MADIVIDEFTIPDKVADDLTKAIRRIGKLIVRPIFYQGGDLGLIHKRGEVANQVMRENPDDNPLTIADSLSHQALKRAFQKHLPDYAQLSEEDDLTPQQRENRLANFDGRGATIVLDPIDGTTNFRNGALKMRNSEPLQPEDLESNILAAIVINRRVAAGWMYNFHTDVMYHARLDQGTYRNRQRIALNYHSRDVEKIRVGIGLAHPAHYFDEASSRIFLDGEHLKPMDEFRAKAQKAGFGDVVNVSLSSSGAYSKILRGEIGAAIMSGAKPWDHLAEALILKEAGGATARLDTQPYLNDNGSINLAASGLNRTPRIPYRGGTIAVSDSWLNRKLFEAFDIRPG